MIAPRTRLRMAAPEVGGRRRKQRSRAGVPPSKGSELLATSTLGTVAHPIDCTVVVVGDQQRAVLHHHHVGRPPDVIVVLDEASEEWLHRIEAAVALQR